MDQYAINDTIVHPTHGIGRIAGVKHEELVEGFEHFYMLEMPEKNMTIHIPMRKMENVGVRATMSKSDFPQVLEALRSEPTALSDDYKTRQKDIRERLSGGLLVDIAEVVRDLAQREKEVRLTKADSDLLSRGYSLLIAEISVIQDMDPDSANELIKQTLAEREVKEPPADDDDADAESA